MKGRTIICSECGEDTFVRREPIYDGFKKVGESIVCVSCGHHFDSEDEVPYKEKDRLAIFADEDRTKKVEIFSSDEKGHNCRHCDHYIINPFVQRCGLHHREVQATDVCDKFTPAKDKECGDDDALEKLLGHQPD
jgi:hypothetical protein